MPRQAHDQLPATTSNLDVQDDLTRAIFRKLLPTVTLGCLAQILCTVLLARAKQDAWLWKLAAVMLAIGVGRVTVVAVFSRNTDRPLTPADSVRWETLYGAATLAYCAAMGVSTLYNFHRHDFPSAFLCTVGSVALSAGLSARVGVRPWIIQLAGILMLGPLAVAAYRTNQVILQAGAAMILLFAIVHCQSVRTQYDIMVDQLRSRRKLREFAEQDTLTGLPNRRCFQQQLATLSGTAGPFAILYIDLDRFKVVNDTFGHATGDTLLQLVAQRLRESIRPTDLLARLGGDEFAILQSPLTTESAAISLAGRINLTIAQPFDIDADLISIGASVGIQFAEQFAGQAHRDPSRLLSTADEALYRVKQAGGGSFHCAAPSPLPAH